MYRAELQVREKTETEKRSDPWLRLGKILDQEILTMRDRNDCGADPKELEKLLLRTEVAEMMRRYGVDAENARIMVERRLIYGDPKINHEGIASAWAPLLQPWAIRIAKNEPLPAYVVALLFAAFKVTRARMRFHEDNFDDAENYLAFARAWQREDGKDPDVELIGPPPSETARLVLRWEEPNEDLSSPGSGIST